MQFHTERVEPAQMYTDCVFMFVCLFVFRPLEADIKENFLTTIGDVFGMERTEATDLYTLLLQCMDHRQSVSKAASGACVCCD